MVLDVMTDELQGIVPEIEPVIRIGMGAGSAQLVQVSYSGMVSIVFTWNFKFLYCFLYFL
jgi:hypothetical protein